MADMRDALKKAGLVSEKQARKAKHEQRLHRKEVGDEGLGEEQRRKDEEFAREREAKRLRDRAIEEKRQAGAQASAGRVDLVRLIQKGIVNGAIGGPKQYFFTLSGGRITFLELTDTGFKRMIGGSAAIVDTLGAVRGTYCIVDTTTAAALQRESPEIVRDWARS